jgi:DNA-binding GntR family transcriptional regulator
MRVVAVKPSSAIVGIAKVMASPSLSQEAYDLLKSEILGCNLRPGERVSSSLLTNRYELALAPIREALSRLAQDKLVQPLPREGYLISPVTMKDAHQLFEAREVIESWTVQISASRMTNDQLAKLRQLASVESHFSDEATAYDYRRANQELHMVLAEVAGNDYITGILSDILGRLERLFHLSHQFFDAEPDEAMYQNHQGLICALERKDAEAAVGLMKNHIQESKTLVIVALTKSPSLVSVNIAGEASR